MTHHWPDGQVREEEPYRCGAFDTVTGEVCTKLSDHDGPHVMPSDLDAGASPSYRNGAET
jgi:hypothetical protein